MSEITDIVRKVFIKSGLNSIEDVLRFRIWTHNQNLLKIDISNDRNPLFQCFIELTEAKFKEIREGQDINISSLDNLKSELIKLFLRCEGKDEKEARFFLLLEEAGNPASFQGYDVVKKKQLKIVEKSALKNLVHFTFDVVDATDEEIKIALIGQIDGLKNLYRASDAKVNELELKLIESRELVSAKLDELAAVRRELELLSSSYENEKRELIAEVGETECKLRREFEKKTKSEKDDFQKQHKIEIDNLKHQQKELRAENKTLKQSLDELQTSLQSETQRCGILEVRLGNTLQEIEQLKSNNAKLDTDYHDKEKNVYTLRTRLAVCEQELKDKACFITSLQKQTDKAVSEKEYFQNYSQDLEKELSFRDETVSKLAKDILKANEIIARQAAELDTLKNKVTVATSVALEQEKVLKQKSEDINRLEKELESEKSEVDKLSKDKGALKKEIEVINESLTLCKNKADIDSKVIAWFSRALRFHSSSENSNAVITNSTPFSDIGPRLEPTSTVVVTM
ncbi:spindle assembly abnormal protein 6 homolog [Nilaparvata lugens]|uniref:spindle assembly abnormal protein 6 homolog n=1 Tax=Nilaparvata lugens TaxID=108931 RepID=UPI00193D9E9B|nr:spindle assembly abnormal protein 6 homolog [Nilaparvata lugens]XP_039286888.1 spindle assembly abnormal protein 6 homolog [Nilaparvata lugens]